MEIKAYKNGSYENVMVWGTEYASSFGSIYKDGVIFINTTVLPCSNSSVHFIPSNQTFDICTPSTPFTLQPGTSYAEEYTLVADIPADTQSSIVILSYVLTAHSNATVRFDYIVLDVGPARTPR